jgi:hypothetical protein
MHHETSLYLDTLKPYVGVYVFCHCYMFLSDLFHTVIKDVFSVRLITRSFFWRWLEEAERARTSFIHVEHALVLGIHTQFLVIKCVSNLFHQFIQLII